MEPLKPNEKLDVVELLKDLDKYEPRRRGWTWREPAPGLKMGPFEYKDCSKPLKNSTGLPPAKCYLDELPSADTNEIAIYWNSPTIFVAACFNSL